MGGSSQLPQLPGQCFVHAEKLHLVGVEADDGSVGGVEAEGGGIRPNADIRGGFEEIEMLKLDFGAEYRSGHDGVVSVRLGRSHSVIVDVVVVVDAVKVDVGSFVLRENVEELLTSVAREKPTAGDGLGGR